MMSSRIPPAYRRLPRFGLGEAPSSHVGVAGATIITTIKDVQTYFKEIDTQIELLDDDVHDQLVYANPAEIKALLASDDTWTPREYLEAELARLKKNATLKSKAKIQDEIRFGTQWRSFYNKWTEMRTPKEHVAEFGYGPRGTWYASSKWKELQVFHREDQSLFAKFKKLGGSPSVGAAPPEHPEDEAKRTEIPWKPILYIAGGLLVVGTGLYLFAMVRPFLPMKAA